MAGAAPLGSGLSAMAHSVVSSRPATEAAFCRAMRVTFFGSMTPALIRSSYSPVAALKPKPSLPPLTFSTTMEPSKPALAAMERRGTSTARRMMSMPACSSSSMALSLSRAFWPRTRATPPPGTMPSSTAARVALSASSTRAFFSFISVSVAAPTWMTATPPTILARRSCSFSLS